MEDYILGDLDPEPCQFGLIVAREYFAKLSNVVFLCLKKYVQIHKMNQKWSLYNLGQDRKHY